MHLIIATWINYGDDKQEHMDTLRGKLEPMEEEMKSTFADISRRKNISKFFLEKYKKLIDDMDKNGTKDWALEMQRADVKSFDEDFEGLQDLWVDSLYMKVGFEERWTRLVSVFF